MGTFAAQDPPSLGKAAANHLMPYRASSHGWRLNWFQPMGWIQSFQQCIKQSKRQPLGWIQTVRERTRLGIWWFQTLGWIQTFQQCIRESKRWCQPIGWMQTFQQCYQAKEINSDVRPCGGSKHCGEIPKKISNNKKEIKPLFLGGKEMKTQPNTADFLAAAFLIVLTHQ